MSTKLSTSFKLTSIDFVQRRLTLQLYKLSLSQILMISIKYSEEIPGHFVGSISIFASESRFEVDVNG